MRVRSDLSVNWFCAAVVSAASGLACAAVAPDAIPPASGTASEATGVAADAGVILERASRLLVDDRPVRAHAIVMALVSSDAALTLTDAESRRALQLLGTSDRAVKALPAIERELQRAELHATDGRLGEAESAARLVLEHPEAGEARIDRARGVLSLLASRKVEMTREAGTLVERARNAFEAADYAGAKRIIAELDEAGIDLEGTQRSVIDRYRTRIQQLEMVRGEPFASDALAMSAMQPGQVRRRRFQNDQPAGTEPAPADPSGTEPTADQPAAADPAAADQPGDEVTDAQEDLIRVAQQLEAQRLLAEANRSYDQARYADADRVYSRLLGQFRGFLTAGQIEQIERQRDDARIRLGSVVGDSSIDILGADRNRRQLAREQAIAQFSNEAQQAEARLASGDFEQARRQAAGALLTLNQARDFLGPAEYEQRLAQNGELLRRIAAAEEEARVRAEEDRLRRLEQDQRERDLDTRRERAERINLLIDSIRALQVDQQYEKALQETDQLLFIEPNNPVGLLLKEVLTDTMLLRRYGAAGRDIKRGTLYHMTENRIATIPPDSIIDYPDDWAGLSRMRGDQLDFAENPLNRAVLASLRDTRLPVNFQDAALDDVLTFLGQFANLEQDIDWPSLEEIGVDPESLVTLRLTNVPLETVYQRVLEKVSDPGAPAGWAVTDGVLTIASDEVLRRNTVLEIYDIRDLLINVPDYDNAPEFDLNTIFQQGGAQGGGGGGTSPFQAGGQDIDRIEQDELIQDLRDIIQNNVDPENWADFGGDTGTIEELNGNFIITQTPKNHRAIVGLLGKLRSVRNMQVNVESRFLLVREDWFEQIGFDVDLYFGENLNEVQTARTIDPSLTLDDFFQTDAEGNISLAQVIDPADSGFGISQPVFAPGTQGDQFSPVRAEQDSFGLTQALGGNLTDIAGAVTSAAPALGISGRFLDDVQVDFLVEATQADQRSVELTAPRLTFTNGQRAYVFVATQFSFVSDLQPVVSDSAVAFDPEINVVSEGVVLDVRGVISADRRYVTLDVDTAVGEVDLESSESVEATAGGGGFTIDDQGNAVSTATVATGTIQTPVVTITRVQTTVTVPDQGTILLGGQRIVNEFETETGVPVLSKIPVLNRFFSNRIDTKEEQTLLILIKPTVLIQSEEEERNFPGLLDSLSR